MLAGVVAQMGALAGRVAQQSSTLAEEMRRGLELEGLSIPAVVKMLQTTPAGGAGTALAVLHARLPRTVAPDVTQHPHAGITLQLTRRRFRSRAGTPEQSYLDPLTRLAERNRRSRCAFRNRRCPTSPRTRSDPPRHHAGIFLNNTSMLYAPPRRFSETSTPTRTNR